MSNFSLQRFIAHQKSLLKDPAGFWLGEVSVESIVEHDRKDPLTDAEKNIVAIEALAGANEELYLHLVADIGIQNHAPLPEFKNCEWSQSYGDKCFQYPKQIEIFLKAGGSLLNRFVEFVEYVDLGNSSVAFFQNTASFASPAEHAFSLNTFSKMDKGLLLEVFHRECFDSSGDPVLEAVKNFNQCILPSLFTGVYPQAAPVSAEQLRETQLMHPLPHGWLISFMTQNRSYDIASNPNSKQVFQTIDAETLVQDTQYSRDIFGVFLADIQDSLNNPDSLLLKEKLSPYEIDDFFDEDWKSTWETDLILATVVRSTLFPQSPPLPEIPGFLDKAAWMACFFNRKSTQISSHICGFIFNHLMLNPSILEKADFSKNQITQLKNAPETLDILLKNSDIFMVITSSLINPSAISLQHLSHHSLNNPNVISKYMEWSGLNSSLSMSNHFTEQESLEIINTHVLKFAKAETHEAYWLKQIQQLKEELGESENPRIFEEYKLLRVAGYKSILTHELMKMPIPLVMEALTLANSFDEDLSLSMVKKHVSSKTIKSRAEEKISPPTPTRF